MNHDAMLLTQEMSKSDAHYAAVATTVMKVTDEATIDGDIVRFTDSFEFVTGQHDINKSEDPSIAENQSYKDAFNLLREISKDKDIDSPDNAKRKAAYLRHAKQIEAARDQLADLTARTVGGQTKDDFKSIFDAKSPAKIVTLLKDLKKNYELRVKYRKQFKQDGRLSLFIEKLQLFEERKVGILTGSGSGTGVPDAPVNDSTFEVALAPSLIQRPEESPIPTPPVKVSDDDVVESKVTMV